MTRSKLGLWKGLPLSIESIQTNGVPFLLKDKKQSTSGQSLSVLNFVEYPPGYKYK